MKKSIPAQVRKKVPKPTTVMHSKKAEMLKAAESISHPYRKLICGGCYTSVWTDEPIGTEHWCGGTLL